MFGVPGPLRAKLGNFELGGGGPMHAIVYQAKWTTASASHFGATSRGDRDHPDAHLEVPSESKIQRSVLKERPSFSADARARWSHARVTKAARKGLKLCEIS